MPEGTGGMHEERDENIRVQSGERMGLGRCQRGIHLLKQWWNSCGDSIRKTIR